MDSSFNQKVRWLKPAIAGLMAAMVLVLALFAASEDLHLKLHQDSPTAHHGPCAICSVAQGQFEAPAVNALAVVAPPSISWTLSAADFTLPQAADFSVASSRGPPAAVSSL
jgi:hypothetical protein